MRGGFTLVELLVVISIIVTLGGLSLKVILSKLKEGNKTQALENIKTVGMALFTFDQDYSSFPCDATIEQVKNNCPDFQSNFGNTYSNDFFRQLIATKKVDQETPFYVKCSYTKKPDNIMTQGKCLAGGECGIGYIMASQTEPLSQSSAAGDTPLLVSVLDNAKKDGTFDPNVFDAKAVIGHIDQSVTTDPVRTNDKMVMIRGKKMLEGGKDSVWGPDIVPVIKPPMKATSSGTSQLPTTSPDDNNH